MATRTIKTRLEISGDREYRDSLKRVNAELAEQKSAMKLLTEEYKDNQNSQEALAKKVGQLKSMYESQTRVLEAASAGYRNATNEKAKYAAQEDLAREKLEAARVELEKLNTATEEGAGKQTELSREIKKYGEELEEASRRHEAASAVVDEWAVRQSRAGTAVNRTAARIREYEGYLEEAGESTDKCATSIDQYGRKVKNASREQEKLNENVDGSESAIESFAAALAATELTRQFSEIAGTLKECAEKAAEFRTALAKVSTIADTTAMDMDTVGKEILALSNDTGQAVTEISEATYGAISAGVKTADAVRFVSEATKLATGGFTDNATSVDILTTALNAYGLELERTSEISDYLITTQNLGKTTVGELASSLGKVIPVAAAYHVEMDNLSSAMAVMTANGIATAESTTYIKAMLNELGDSGSTVSRVLEEKTGVSFGRLMQQGYHLGGIMEILATAVDNDKGAFNELWSSSEAGIGALSLLSAGTQRYDDVLDQMRMSAGATEKAYAKMTDTAEMARKKLENAFNNLKIAVGSELQDQMKGMYDRGTDLLEWAAAFVQENEWLVPVLEGVVLGIGALSAAIAGFTVVTKVIIPLWNQFTMALSANPVGLVLVSLTALTALLGPFIASLADSTDEIGEQTTAWKEHVDALNGTVEAYREQNREAEQAIADTKALAETLAGLAAKESRTTAEKEAMAEAADRLNARIPDLGLKYDMLSDSISMTTEELDGMLAAMERQEKYEASRNNYADVYAANRDSVRELEKAREDLAAASEKYERLKTEYWTSPSVFSDTFDDMVAAGLEVMVITQAVEEMQEAVSGSNDVLAEMAYDMNLYIIETASMTEAERDAVDAMLEAAEAKRDCLPEYYEEIELIAQTAQGYDAYAVSVRENTETVMQKLQELEEKYQESYLSAYDNISGQIGLFNQMKAEGSLSIEEMIAAMGSQVEYMNEYAENIRLAMEYGVDEGILGRLTDGSEESAAILQEIVNSGSEKIQELNEEFARVSEGKEAFSSAVAELETYYGEEMDRLVRETKDAVKEMARYDDAYRSAVETCNGIMAGVDAQWGNVVEKYRALSKAAWDAYNKGQEIHSPSRKFIWSAEMSIEGLEEGVDKGRETVLEKYERLAADGLAGYQKGLEEISGRSEYASTAERTAVSMLENCLRTAQGNQAAREANGEPVQNFYIYTPVKSPSEMMRAARLEQQYGMAGE